MNAAYAYWCWALIGALQLALACHSTPAPPGAATPNRLPRGSGRKPVVLIASSAIHCEDGSEIQIAADVEFETEELRRAFPAATTIDLSQLATITVPEAHGRPMVFIYSGHAELHVESGKRATRLCLKEGRFLNADDLFIWIAAQRPAWATVILNACETALVNPAVVQLPISVISASPNAVTAAVLPDAGTDSKQERPRGTDFMHDFLALLDEARTPERASTVDRNCDGTVDDGELFSALEGRLRTLDWRRWVRPSAIPLPKLRRNADVPLPVEYLPARRCTDAATLENSRTVLPALWKAVSEERQSVARGELAPAARGWFFLNDAADHDGCVSGRATGNVASACTALSRWLRPLSFDLGHRIDLHDTRYTDTLIEAARTLARHSVATEVYKLELASGWGQLERLRDAHILRVSPATALEELVPVAPRRVLISGDGRQVWRFARRVNWTVLSSQGAEPVVCRAPDGQCFEFPDPPTRLD